MSQTLVNKNSPFFCSWSGGKDSCLALYHALREEGRPRLLLTMLTEGAERSRSHGLHITVIESQAEALGIPLVTRAATWDGYEAAFISALREFKEAGIEVGVFGDIDMDDHRKWVERACSSASIQPYLPLWKKARHDLLEELLEAGFTATIVAVQDGVLDKRFLGKTINEDVIKEIGCEGIDASGEGGEYHTVVTDGPIFSQPVQLEMDKQVLRDGYWFLDVSVK